VRNSINIILKEGYIATWIQKDLNVLCVCLNIVGMEKVNSIFDIARDGVDLGLPNIFRNLSEMVGILRCVRQWPILFCDLLSTFIC
jgi:hypothetical protein